LTDAMSAKESKMRISEKEIPLYLSTTLSVIDSSINDASVAEAVMKAGYTREKLQEGRSLYNKAVEMVSRQIVFSEKTHQLEEHAQSAKRDAQNAYQAFFKMAKENFGKNVLASLGLIGSRPRSIEDFLAVAITCFDNAIKISEIREKLSVAGYEESVLQSERLKIANFNMAVQTIQATRNSLRQATNDRNDTLRELKSWVDRYLKAAQKALCQRSDLLEKLGGHTCNAVQPNTVAVSAVPPAFTPVAPAENPSATVAPSTTTGTTGVRPGPTQQQQNRQTPLKPRDSI